MGFEGGCAHLILGIANFLYFCGGVVIMTLGAIGLANVDLTINSLTYIPMFSSLNNVLNLYGITYGPAVYLVIAGVLAIVLSFLGCGSVYKKHNIVSFVYGGCNLVFMLFNVGLIMYHVIAPYNIQGTVAFNMLSTLRTSFSPVSISSNGTIILPASIQAQSWVEMQFNQGCCGVDGYMDYQVISWSNNITTSTGVQTFAKVPPSCCVLTQPYLTPSKTQEFVNLTQCLTNPPQYTNTKGCLSYIMAQFTQYNYIYTVVAAALTGFQAIILVCSMRVMAGEFEKIEKRVF